MSLAMLLYPPPTKNGLDEFFAHHIDHHRRINAAILRVRGVDVPEFGVYPVRADSLQDFLLENQRWHDATNQVLGTAGQDLTSVDWTDASQRDAWIWLHFSQHSNWAQALGNGT